MADSSSRTTSQVNIPTDQRQTFEQYRNLIAEHVRERFGSTMGQQSTSRATGEEISEWLRQQSVDTLAQPVQQSQKAGSSGSR